MLTYIHPPDTPVAPAFRDLVQSLFPNLTPLLLRLLDHVLFGSYFDRDTGELLMGWELLNSLRGPSPNKDFSVPKLIARFSEAAFPIEVSASSWHGGRASRLVRAEIPAVLVEARNDMLRNASTTSLVGLVSGDPVAISGVRAALKAEAESLAADSKHRRIDALLEYLNGLPPELFDSVHERIPVASEVALGIANPVAKRQQTGMLHRLRSCPQPFYKPVATTARIYAHGASYLNMASPIGDRLTRQWAKLDVKQAQLMIVSRLWGQEGIRAYIDRLEGSLWEDVCQYAMVEYTPQNKAVLKTCLYSVVFGMEKSRARKNVADQLGEDAAEGCVSHPVIASLLKARRTKVDDLLLAGGCDDAFRNRLSVHDWPSGTTDRKRALSILACQAQSFEMPLLMPVVDYARGTESEDSPLYVTGWLHDGVWLHCDDAEGLSNHVDNAVALIKGASLSTLGFEIGVDVETPSP